MTDPESAHTDSAVIEGLSLPAIRLLVLERMLWIWGVLGGIIVAIVAVDDLAEGRYGASLFYVGVYAILILCLLPRPLPYLWRSMSPLAMLYVVGTHEIYNHGLNSAGGLFYYALILFTCILIGARAAVIATAAALLSLCGVSYGYMLGLPPGAQYTSLVAYLHVECLPDVVSLLLLSAMSITFLSLLLRSLECGVQNSQAYLSEIARERNRLVRLIEERDRAEQQLRQAQKMEAVGQLAGGVAHDFNNLLQVVSAHTEIMLGQLEPGTGHHAQLKEVKKASERAAALTRQLLAYSRQQVMAPVYLNLNELIDNLMNMVHRVIPESIETRFRPGPGLGTVHADPVQIEQVLLNLCLNARDAMPGGGRLTIETQNAYIDEEFLERHPGGEAGPYVLINVADTGVGMDLADKNHIFEPFYTTKTLGAGTGLGLAMAYGIVKQHNGLIHAFSEPGMGAVFKTYLPRVEHAAAVLERDSESPAAQGTETVLLAEDDEAVRELIIGVLESAGFTILPASDGEEAVGLFQAHQDTIDLLLFDIVMPRMGGREACEAIRTIHPATRVLFMSGYAAEGLQGRFELGKDTGFIQKPYRTQQLVEKVREMLDG